jgi:hypothetical protein
MVVASKAWDLMKIGAEYEEQKGILDNLGKQYGTTADQIVDAMRKASTGLIADSDLMKTALEGIAKGLNPDQLIALAGAAEILGDAVGVTAKTALDDLTQALESGRVKGLKTYLGTALDLTAAFGDLAGKMTAAEKSQAMYNLVMIQATSLQSQQTGKVGDAADKIEALEARWKNLTLTLGIWTKNVMVATWEFGKFLAQSVTDPFGTKAIAGYVQEAQRGAQATRGMSQAQDALTVAYEQNNIGLKNILQNRKEDEKAIKTHSDTAKKAAVEEREIIDATLNYSILEIKRDTKARKENQDNIYEALFRVR